MSNGPEFFQTGMGRTFYEGTMPKIARALERLATVLENEGLTIEAIDLLRENLRAWEGEEDSVQKEHAPLIFRTRSLLKQLEAKK
jgi:hypothetical protein